MRCRCGRLRSVCGHPTKPWYPQRAICRATMAAAAAQRKYERLHKDAPYHDGTFTSWAAESSDSHPFHFLDGVTIWAAEFDVNPDDHFLGGSSRPDPAGDPGLERW